MPRDRFERTRRPLKASELVDRVVNAHRLAEDLREVRLFTEWATLVGERVGARTRPLTIVDRVLVIEVASSPWLHELRMLRPKICSDLLDRLGLPRFFDDLRFVLAKDSRRAELMKPRVRQLRPPKPLRIVDPANVENQLRIRREAEAIEDPELAALVARVRITHDR
ncbi:MAG TPA: DUF721 domain-containing protein [Kofleriaceae bacterium]|jgi:hypothetical protein